jgi:hypothetical protein
MVAGSPHLLRDEQPDFAELAGLGDRFRYWRGVSGRRYLFTLVAAETLADFPKAVGILADRLPDGHLAARDVFEIAATGVRPIPGGEVFALVHLLALTTAERRRVIADLCGQSRLSAAA